MPNFSEKIKNNNLNEEEAGKITLRVINFIYSVVNEKDIKLTKEDKKFKYDFLKRNYEFFKNEIGINL